MQFSGNKNTSCARDFKASVNEEVELDARMLSRCGLLKMNWLAYINVLFSHRVQWHSQGWLQEICGISKLDQKIFVS